MKLPISAFIITKNEEARIGRAISSVIDFVDEVIVVDSGSDDRTCVIAEDLGALVYHREWNGYGRQKRIAEDLCSNPWLLNIDADETVTPELKAEISSLFEDVMKPAAFSIKILNIYPGDDKPRLFANDYDVVRLYHKDIGRYRDNPVFDRVVTSEEADHLKHAIWHYPYVDFAHAIEKAAAFSTFRARHSGRRKFLPLRLIYEFPLSFLKFYIGRRHITGGWKGFAFSMIQAFMRFMRVVKMLEMQTDKKRLSLVGRVDQSRLKRI